MIIDLTIENLIKLGLSEQRAAEFFNESNKYIFQGNEGNFYLFDNKVYTDIDYYRMTYFNRGAITFPLNCPDLIDEYFNLSLNKYLLEQKEVLKSIFVVEDQKKKFISKEILNAKNRIENQKVMLKRLSHFGSERKENAISILEAYINFCESRLNQPQQPEAVKPDEVKNMHFKIFASNSFNLWERMFEHFKINEKKRTDLSFMYEVMIFPELIHETVSKKNIEDWINETYTFDIDKIHFTDIKSKANENRMSTYNLLKQSK
jgi:hypothetical protein